MSKFFETRQVITYATKYVEGSVCDICTDRAKYSDIIRKKASSYIHFDVVKNEYSDVIGNPLQLPFANDFFDTVISIEFIEHIEEPWKFIAEINRILKKGGICILTSPYIFPWHNRGKDLDFFRFSKEGLIYSFEKHGFKILESNTYNGFFETLFLIFRKEYFYNCNNFIIRRIIKIANIFFRFLDSFNNNKNVYSNVYIIAQKI
jgi:SAM-dependent methyltransferase